MLLQRECPKSAGMIGFASTAISILNEAELSASEPRDLPLVHMDVDQSFLPIPSTVKAAIFESFARQNITECEVVIEARIQNFVKSNYGFSTDSSAEFIYGDSPLALFNKLVLCCIQENGTLFFPSGSNGTYSCSAKFMKANVVMIPTHLEEGFKLTEKALASVLGTVKRPWVYLSGPTINPTGLLYSNEEIRGILSVCAKFGARVIIDISFSGLEFETDAWNGWNLEESLPKLTKADPFFCVSLLGGLSFEMLTGGLTFGFLVLNQPLLIDAFHSFPGLNKPHSTVKYAIKKLMGLREQKAKNLLEAIAEQKKILKCRAKCLKEVCYCKTELFLYFAYSTSVVLKILFFKLCP